MATYTLTAAHLTRRAKQTEALAAHLGMTVEQLVEDTKRQARRAKALRAKV